MEVSFTSFHRDLTIMSIPILRLYDNLWTYLSNWLKLSDLAQLGATCHSLESSILKLQSKGYYEGSGTHLRLALASRYGSRIIGVGGRFRLSEVPEDSRTHQICVWAVQNQGLDLASVPMSIQTPELYKIALTQNGMTLLNIKTSLVTREMCQIAVQGFDYIPTELRPILSRFIPQCHHILKLGPRQGQNCRHLSSYPSQYCFTHKSLYDGQSKDGSLVVSHTAPVHYEIKHPPPHVALPYPLIKKRLVVRLKHKS